MYQTIMKGVLLILAAIVMGLVVAIIIGLPMMLLWNWLMPELFGMPELTFWQAVGLSVLGSLLTGSGVPKPK